MRKQMLKQLPSDEDMDEDQFNLSFHEDGIDQLNSGQMTQREDDQFVYYEVPLRGLKEEKLDVQVSQGQVTISGKTEKKTEEKGSATYFSSSFHRSFPVPPGVDAEHLQVEPSQDRFVIKFPKK
jgi:HSP20 family molecular chaperone IbpA